MRNEAGQGNEPEIRASDDGSVRILTLNRPDRINAFTAASYRHLARALNDADADASVSVVLLEGAGQGFSSGVDLAAIGVDDLSLSECFDDLVASLIRFSKPLLAAVHGVAVGFGATILLHCDIVMVADTGEIAVPVHGSRNHAGGGQQRPAAAPRRDSEGGRPAPHVTLHHRYGGGTDRSGRPLPPGGVTALRGTGTGT